MPCNKAEKPYINAWNNLACKKGEFTANADFPHLAPVCCSNLEQMCNYSAKELGCCPDGETPYQKNEKYEIGCCPKGKKPKWVGYVQVCIKDNS